MRIPTVSSIEVDPTKSYYLAGPMSGYDDYNYPAFTKAAGELRDFGLKINSPHESPWPDGYKTMSGTELWTEMMKRTESLLLSSDGIILLVGWPQSKGARDELKYALTVDYPVFYYNNFTLTTMNKAGVPLWTG